MNELKVENSFRKGKVCSFLDDLTALCAKHKVSISTHSEGTKVAFHDWDCFINLEVDVEGASLYWPRIQTDIVIRRRKA
ncbi:MAG: hypothetical protein IMF19_15490 [Proteobacteria bacterium]|nr:hypothetical protein [Pseudomonadota bacterium]